MKSPNWLLSYHTNERGCLSNWRRGSVHCTSIIIKILLVPYMVRIDVQRSPKVKLEVAPFLKILLIVSRNHVPSFMLLSQNAQFIQYLAQICSTIVVSSAVVRQPGCYGHAVSFNYVCTTGEWEAQQGGRRGDCPSDTNIQGALFQP